MFEHKKRSLNILVYLALTLGSLLVFWQVHNFDFTDYDDNLYVSENQHVLNGFTGENIIWAFTTGYQANWHPLTWLSLMLDCQLFGVNPGLIHLVNVLLHVANTLLLFTVLRKMTDSLWPSAFVAAAFALHPMHVESVAWIAERKDVLSIFFWMLTLLAYVGYVRHNGQVRYLLSILLFALGLLAKPMLVTLPFVLLLLDYWPLNRFAPVKIIKTSGRQSRKHDSTHDKRQILYRLIVEKIPFLALVAVSSVITFLVQRSGGTVLGVGEVPLTARIANATVSYGIYILKMLWPKNLAVFYPYVEPGLPQWQIMLAVVVLLGATLLAIISARRHKYLLVGWLWFIGTLIPVIGLVQIGKQAFADRYTYVPYIGLFIMIAWGIPELLSKWPYRKIALSISMPIVITALGICAYRQVSYWNNSGTLFSHALNVTKNNYIAYYNFAADLHKRGNPVLAIEYFKKAIQIKPNYESALFGLGLTLAEQGNTADAIEYFQKTLQFKPDAALAAYVHNNLGVALRSQGKAAEAFVHFVKAVHLMPDFAEARYNLADALFRQGRLDEALDQFREAHRLKPDWLEPMNNLAWIMATHPEIKNRDVNEVVRLARRTCELTDYQNPILLGTLAAAYASAGRFPEAINTAQKAITLAEDANQPQVKNIIQYHLTFYTQNIPYIESDQKPLPNSNKP